MLVEKLKSLGLLIFFNGLAVYAGAVPDWVQLPGCVPAVVARLKAISPLPATNQLDLAIDLPLRDPAGLDALLAQLYNPASTNFHKFLTPLELAARYGPTEQDYAAVRRFAESNGLTVVREYPNRMVLNVVGNVSNIEQAFHITLHTYRHPTEPRDFFAPDTEPSVPASLKVISIEGLNNFSLPRPAGLKVNALTSRPLSFSGTGPNHEYMGNDFRNAYVPGATNLNGAGQTVALLEYSGYYMVDITNYENAVGAQTGVTNYVPLKNVIVGHRTPSTANNDEVALDIEMAIAMAPKLSQVIVYEERNADSSVLSQIQSDNLAKQVSSSWMVGNWSSSTATAWDNILMLMAAQGQSYFQSSGDSDAYTGTQLLDNGITVPADSPYATIVGGTTLTMSSYGVAWNSETVWNYNLNGIPNEGSGGGVSTYYSIPSWQTNISMANNGGSASMRNIPDVALTADNIYVCYNNGDSSGTYYFMGTSAAAPLWAGFTALVNQQTAQGGLPPVGFVNPALYALATNASYASLFHDITTGNNIGTNTPGLYYAVANYDLATGLGTPNGTNLINALAPPAFPFFTSQPAGQTVTNGANVVLTANVGGLSPLSYQWQFNGTNLPAGGNLSGVASNVLSITAATTNNAGNYRLVVTNNYGSVTSSVAVLNVGFAPVVAVQPAGLTVLSGSNAVFSATVTGSPSLTYQWRKNGANLVNGAGVSGATSNTLSLTAVTTNSSSSYSLFVTNLYGSVTSSVATLTVVLPPVIASSSFTNRTIQCGQNTNLFAIAVSGTAPLSIQWSLDGTPIPGATNTSFALTNLSLPDHTVAAVVTNLYGSAASNALLTVQDTLGPVITLNGTNPFYVELGSAYLEPGATAFDACAGVEPVVISGTVNTNAISTNTVTYTASDGSGNTNSVTRTVIVRDTTSPTILWSFTNLVLTANSNCVAVMPDATGTNFIQATDLSGTLTITQNPTNNAMLQLGTNVVVLTVADASGNKSYSTNLITVRDETPPFIVLNGSNPMTNELGVPFVDPGVIAGDDCSGLAAVMTSGTVNVNVVGTNTLTYIAVDGSGNTNSVARTVIVRDTTPPTILWSFTNLVLAANSNCVAAMPDVTGTNFIQATDLSEPLAISQAPTNNSVLPLGTNAVVIAVADAFGNTAYLTNTIVVEDRTPPVILLEPQNRTNNAGDTASFSVAATACTPISYQWFFGSIAITNQTGVTLTLSNVTSLGAGNYSVVVTAAGGSTTSTVATLTVNLLASSMSVASSENPSGFKYNLIFTAAVPTNATGTIQFLTNGTAFDLEPLVAGVAASTNISVLPRGTNLVTAIYSGDDSFLPDTNFLAQIVTNHPPTAAPAFYTNMLNLPLNIAIADLATSWSDVDGDIVSLAGVSVSTNGIVVTNTGSALVYFSSNNITDQFTCTITDGWGGTNFQTVNILSANPTPLINGVVGAGDGSVILDLGGAPGYTYVLETTTNILPANWQPVATNTLGTNGDWQFDDAQATNFMQRFYRLKLAP